MIWESSFSSLAARANGMSLVWVNIAHMLLPVLTGSQDTFVVGCAFSDKNIYPETFEGNPDFDDAVYSTEDGIYEPHCGLDNVMLSWGHDEVTIFH
jgi:hypothetical protein